MKKHAKTSILTVTNAKYSNTQYRCTNAGVLTTYKISTVVDGVEKFEELDGFNYI